MRRVVHERVAPRGVHADRREGGSHEKKMVTVAGGDGVWLVGTGPYRRLGAFSIKVPGGGGAS